MDDSKPPLVVRASNLGLDTPLSHRLLGLMLTSAAVSLAVLLTNHPPLRWLGRGKERDGKKKKAQHNVTILVTDLLACVALLNGLLAFFGKWN